MRTIIIITYSNYPNGSASAIRYCTFAHTFTDIGYEVIVLSKSHITNNDKISAQSITSNNRINRFFLFPFRAIRKLKVLSKIKEIDGVFLGSDVNALHAYILRNWCKSHNIKCIFDATEWYSKEQFQNGLLTLGYWEKTILNKFIINKNSRVVAISSFLYRYFKNKGCKVTQIPIIYNSHITTQENLRRNLADDRLSIIYAGTHPLMDNVHTIIHAISLLSTEERSRLLFKIYGLEESQIRLYVSDDILNKVGNSVIIMGRRPNSEVIDAYLQSDFSVVLRNPLLRVNKAGFPSKVVESMRLGVPLISNYTSDLKNILDHNENSIIIDSLDEVEISMQIRKLLQMPKTEIMRLGENARLTLQEKLNSKLFEDKFEYIIS